jgi:integrase
LRRLTRPVPWFQINAFARQREQGIAALAKQKSRSSKVQKKKGAKLTIRAQTTVAVTSCLLLDRDASFVFQFLDMFMLGKQAKILGAHELADLLAFADCSRQPLRNRVIVLLSAKAGLRAGEIASLTWDMVLDASGQLSNVIELRDVAAKKGSGRPIPMHPELSDALSAWRQVCDGSGHIRTLEPDDDAERPGIGPSRRRSVISTATPRPSESWCR